MIGDQRIKRGIAPTDEALMIEVALPVGMVEIGSEFSGVEKKAYSAYFVYAKRLD